MTARRPLRTLIYKRTHLGDPDVLGRFGIHGCMGRVRAWSFEAVIGIGGIGAEPTAHGIDGRVTWIGIGPRHSKAKDARGPLVTFDHFVLLDRRGPLLHELAPRLAKRMYDGRVRALLNTAPLELREVERILRLAADAPPSRARRSSHEKGFAPCRCGKRHSSDCPNRPGRIACMTPARPTSSSRTSRVRTKGPCN
jgi:hypothetical protein